METINKLNEITGDILKDLPQDPEAISDYLLLLASLKGRINEIIPEAQQEYNNEVAKQTEDLLKLYPSIASNSSAWKNLLKGKMATLQNVLDLCDRIRSTIECHIKVCISVLSYQKIRP